MRDERYTSPYLLSPISYLQSPQRVRGWIQRKAAKAQNSQRWVALRATTETGGCAGLRPRPAGRGRIRVQAHIRPGPRLGDAGIAATRHGNTLRGTRKPHGKWLDRCRADLTSNL